MRKLPHPKFKWIALALIPGPSCYLPNCNYCPHRIEPVVRNLLRLSTDEITVPYAACSYARARFFRVRLYAGSLPSYEDLLSEVRRLLAESSHNEG